MTKKYCPGVYASRDCTDPRVLQALQNAKGTISEVRMRELDPPIADAMERIKDCSRVLSFAAKITDGDRHAWQPMIAFTCGDSQEVAMRELEMPPCEHEEEAFHTAHRLSADWLRTRNFVLFSEE